jgi:hypothetical protein
MKKVLGTIALIALALGLFGCSSTPSASQVEQDVKTALTDGQTNTMYDVVSVNKTNGKKAGESYEAEVEYTLKFRTSYVEWAKSAVESARGNIMAQLAIPLFRMMYGDFKAGDVKKCKTWFAYSKTEKGWQFDGQKKDKTSTSSFGTE